MEEFKICYLQCSKGVVEVKNNRRRTTKLEYLQHILTVVAIFNDKGDVEMKSTNKCREGETVWVIEADNTFTRTFLY